MKEKFKSWGVGASFDNFPVIIKPDNTRLASQS